MAMRRWYTFINDIEGTHVYARGYLDDQQQFKQVCVVEEGKNSKKSLDENRMTVARTVTEDLGTTPDRVTWLERGRDGKLREYQFEVEYGTPPHPPRLDPPGLLKQDQQLGAIPPLSQKYRVSQPVELSDEKVLKLEAQLGEKLETNWQQVTREWRTLSGQQRKIGPDHDL